MRTTGYWTKYAGEERQVAGRTDGPMLQLRDRSDPTRLAEQVEADQVGDVLHVSVRANWRGGKVVVSHLEGDDAVLFLTDDRTLAARERLYGDQYSGWGGVALVRELSSIEEVVKVVRRSEGRA
ncbi:hypothetical protein ACW0JT_25095 [Arthrobacter sp. SA17]